ncbi:MAG: hypothetical protein LBQ41_01330 [Candidatus Ancillula sp.]|jgi:hypothetical protein|nr:hypothetical protein [Candidatus Ancillula sp.]
MASSDAEATQVLPKIVETELESPHSEAEGIIESRKSSKKSILVDLRAGKKMLDIVLLVLALIIALTISQITLPLVAIVILVRYLPLPARLAFNFPFRVLLSISLVFAYYSTFALGTYWSSVKLCPLVFNLVLYVFAAILVLFGKRELVIAKRSMLDFIPATLVFFFYSACIFMNGFTHLEFSDHKILQNLAKAEDDSGNHLYIFGKFFTDNNSSYFNDSYTAGQEWTTSLLSRSLISSVSDPSAIWMVYFYSFFKVLALALATLALTVFVHKLYRRVVLPHAKNKGAGDYIIIQLLSLALAVFIITPMYRNGFYSFVPVLGYVLVICTLLLAANHGGGRLVCIYGFIVLCAITTTWFIAAPVVLIVLIVTATRCVHKSKLIWVLPPLTLSLISLILILLLFLTSPETPNASDALLIQGGYPTMPRYFVYAIILIILAFVIYDRVLFRSRSLDLLNVFLMVSTAVLLALYVYMYVAAKGSSYYVLKFETVCLTVFIPVVCVFLIQLVARAKIKPLYYLTFILVPLLYFGSVKIFEPGNDYLAYVKDFKNNGGMLDLTAEKTIIDKLEHTVSDPIHNDCIVFVTEPYINGIISTNLANNLTNHITLNHCAPSNLNTLYNTNKLTYELFANRANKFGINYRLFLQTSENVRRVVEENPDDNLEVVEY